MGDCDGRARASRSSSLSGLPTLVRKLSVSMEGMQANEQALEDVDCAPPMWGTRYGGLAGQRSDDLGPDPPVVLSHSSLRSRHRHDRTQSLLRLPIDEVLCSRSYVPGECPVVVCFLNA